MNIFSSALWGKLRRPAVRNPAEAAVPAAAQVFAMLQAGAPMATVDLDVLDRDNGDLYWERSDRFDTVLDLTFARPGLDALCRVMEGWIAHFRGAEAEEIVRVLKSPGEFAFEWAKRPDGAKRGGLYGTGDFAAKAATCERWVGRGETVRLEPRRPAVRSATALETPMPHAA